MTMTNPYNLRTMIPIDSDMFFGREKEIRRIEGMLSGDTPRCVSIIGERRIGKSSLAFRVFHKIKKAEDTIAVFLDSGGVPGECKTSDDFFQLLNQKFLEDNPKNALLGKKEGKIFEDYSSFRAYVKGTGRKRIKSIIFIDEFEHFPDKPFADDTFFSNLRSVANNPENRLAFVTISQSYIKDLTIQSIQSSGFWNIFDIEVIGLLNHDHIDRLRTVGFEKTNFKLTAKEIEEIRYYAGDFPFFNQVVCGFIWDSKVDNDPIEWEKLEVALTPYYNKLWENRTKEEQKMLKHLKHKKYKSHFALKEMQTRGLLINRKDFYFPFSDFFNVIIDAKKIGKRKKKIDIGREAKEINYGVTDYEVIRKENSYYVDKTGYLSIIEKSGKYLFYIRPRRFGKTLFISMMESYYDISRKEQFDFLFEGTNIYNNPTKEKNSYLILRFDFSLISCAAGKLEDSFRGHVLEAAGLLISKYKSLLNVDENEKNNELKEKKSASDILRHLISLCQKSNQKLFVVIDEYDNFSNTILSTGDENEYQKLTRDEGFFRDFFKVIKGGTSGTGAPISRLFITGVSPVTLNDIASSLNISRNISVDHEFNEMMGFNETEVKKIIEYYKKLGRVEHDTEYLREIMKNWYNSYVFSKKSGSKLYNSDMVLYFLNEYLSSVNIPDYLIDHNAKMDYSKLKHLIFIDKGGEKKLNGNFSLLRQVVEDGSIKSKLVKEFPVETLAAPENFISLLFYFGLLTIKKESEGMTVFEIPNQTIKTLYYDYIIWFSNKVGLTSINMDKLNSLLQGMAYYGKWREFFKYLSDMLNECTSLRDFIREEKIIQGFLLAWLGISDYFIVNSEKEMNKGFADIVLEPFLARYPDIRYSYILELKYLKKGEVDNEIEQIKIDARKQLKKYSLDKKFKKQAGETKLIKLLLVFSLSDLIFLDEIGE
ncbi:MAG: AAA family ATPase [Candidatus Aminicenantes bacterium]|nr:MAG: AAA family ATPase [Candidatus Aminicenantes bacterium]